jgi:hypothetical protein
MSDWKGKFLLLVTLAIAPGGAIQNGWGQEAGLRFRGSVGLVSPVQDWLGDGWFNIGQTPLPHASMLYVGNGYEKSDGDTWIGDETVTVDFGRNALFAPNDSFQMKCHFVLEAMTSPTGVYRIFETCTITNGKGAFQGASGLVTSSGSFGPGMSWPGLKPDGQSWYCTAEYDGIILGVDAKGFVETFRPKSSAPLQSRSFVRRR